MSEIDNDKLYASKQFTVHSPKNKQIHITFLFDTQADVDLFDESKGHFKLDEDANHRLKLTFYNKELQHRVSVSQMLGLSSHVRKARGHSLYDLRRVTFGTDALQTSTPVFAPKEHVSEQSLVDEDPFAFIKEWVATLKGIFV